MNQPELLSISKAAGLLGISIDTLRRWDKKGKLKAVRQPSGHRYYRKKDILLLIEDPETLTQTWASAKTNPLSQAKYYCQSRDIFQARLELMQLELEQSSTLSTLYAVLIAVIGEIGNNTFDHNLGNWPDIPGLFFSYNLSTQKIILADRGQGILKTLKTVKPSLKNHTEALQTAFTEIITGRAPEQRGNGLKFVREIITHYPITLTFQTGDAILSLKEGQKKLAFQKSSLFIPGCFAVIQL